MMDVLISIFYPIALMGAIVGGFFVMKRNRFWGYVIVIAAALDLVYQFI